MAKVVITLKIMPESPDTDLHALTEKAKGIVLKKIGKTETKVEIEPVAFGLKAIKLTFVADEAKGSTDPIEEEIDALDEVNSCETIDARRAIG